MDHDGLIRRSEDVAVEVMRIGTSRAVAQEGAMTRSQKRCKRVSRRIGLRGKVRFKDPQIFNAYSRISSGAKDASIKPDFQVTPEMQSPSPSKSEKPVPH